MLKNVPRSIEVRVPAVLRFWRGSAARARPTIKGLQRYSWSRQFSPRFVFAFMPSRWRFYRAAYDRASSHSVAARAPARLRAVQAKASTIAAASERAAVRSRRTVALPSPLRAIASAARVMANVDVTPLQRARAPSRSVARARVALPSQQARGAIPVPVALGRENRAMVRYVVLTRSAPATPLPPHPSRRSMDRTSRSPLAPNRTRDTVVSPVGRNSNSHLRGIERSDISGIAQRSRRAFSAHGRAARSSPPRLIESVANRVAAPATRNRLNYRVVAASTRATRADSGQPKKVVSRSYRSDRSSARKRLRTFAGAGVRSVLGNAPIRGPGALPERGFSEVTTRSKERTLGKITRKNVARSVRSPESGRSTEPRTLSVPPRTRTAAPLARTTEPRTGSAPPRLRLAQHQAHIISLGEAAPSPQPRMTLRQGPTRSPSYASRGPSAQQSDSIPERRRTSGAYQEEPAHNGSPSEPIITAARRLLLPLVQETVFSERAISRLASGVMARLDRSESAEAYRKSGAR